MKKIALILLLINAHYIHAQNLIPFRGAKGHWGYRNTAGKIVVPPKYEFEAHEFREGRAIVRNSGLMGYGFIDEKGKEVVSPQFNFIFDFVNGLAKACQHGKDVYGTGGKWGFIDKTGEIIIPLIYDRIDGNFENNGYVHAKTGSRTLILDRDGKEIKFPSADQVTGNFSKHKLAPARKNSKWGFIDREGNITIPFQYDGAVDFSGGLAAVKKGTKWGFINELNEMVIEPGFDQPMSFHAAGYAIVNIKGRYGCINSRGIITIPAEYTTITASPGSKVILKKDNKIGFADPLSGQLTTPFIYDEVKDFTEGMARVKKGNKYGYIDSLGKEIIPPVYDYAATSFNDGLAYVSQNNLYGYINRKGKLMIKHQYRYATEFQGSVASVTDAKGQRYFIDKTGKQVK